MSKRWLSSVDRAQREVLPLHLALYHAAREYPGGTKAVAAVFGLNPNTLQHKLNPAETRHRIALEDLEAVLGATQDPRILDSIGELAGGALWVRAVERRGAPRRDQRAILAALADLHERQGQMIESVRQCLADDIDPEAERNALRLCTRRVLEAVLSLELSALEGEHDDGGLV